MFLSKRGTQLITMLVDRSRRQTCVDQSAVRDRKVLGFTISLARSKSKRDGPVKE